MGTALNHSRLAAAGYFCLWHSFGKSSDHGRSDSQKSVLLSSIWSGIAVRICLKYSYTFRLFAFAVSTRLYMIALAFAPDMVSIITKFFLPIQKSLMDCSANYPNIRINQRAGYKAFHSRKEELRYNRIRQRCKSKCNSLQPCRNGKSQSDKHIQVFRTSADWDSEAHGR